MSNRLAISAAVALLAIGGFAAVLVMRGPAPGSSAGRPSRAERRLQSPVVQERLEPAAPARPQSAQARRTSNSNLPAIDEARVRESVRNLRCALASGNEAVQKVLVNALRKDRAAAEHVAREDLSHARSAAERDLALKTLEALGRMP